MAELLLDSFLIEGFRCFDDLRIDHLARVNLVTGPNGIGKTALLEAIEVYANNASPWTLVSQLEHRREWPEPPDGDEDVQRLGRERLRSFGSLFSSRPDLAVRRGQFRVGPTAKPLTLTVEPNQEAILAALPGIEQMVAWRPGFSGFQGPLLHVDLAETRILWVDLGRYAVDEVNGLSAGPPRLPLEWLGTRRTQEATMGEWWDQIALTPAEIAVVEMLQVVAPQAERVTFLGGRGAYRTAHALEAGSAQPVTVASLGEGAERAVFLALALAASRGGLLLIDELDAGLHWSAFHALWRGILSQAQALEVQVIATTHSRDCVEGFQQALAESPDADGQLIRLHRGSLGRRTALYDRRLLSAVAEHDIEVR